MRNTQGYMSLPFNPKLKQRAKELRKAGMLHEALLWNQLKRKQFQGLDFDRQKIIGNYIVDFFCAEKAFVIEVDGVSHQGREDYDAERDAYLNGLGLTIIRIAAKDVLQNMEAVLVFLADHLANSPPLEGNFTRCASPNSPPLEGCPKGGVVSLSPRSPPRQAAPATPPEEGNLQPRFTARKKP